MTYTIRPGDLNADLDASESVFTVTNGSAFDIDEVGGQTHELANLDMAIPVPQSSGSLSDIGQIVIDGSVVDLEDAFVPIVVSSISVTAPQSYYRVGDVVSITVHMSGPVSVDTTGGVPSLHLNIRNGDSEYAEALYNAAESDPVQNSGGILVFEYTIKQGDFVDELNYPFNNAIFLNGGTIFQTVSTGEGDVNLAPSLSLPLREGLGSLSGQYTITIDAVPPGVPTGTTTGGTTTNNPRPTFSGTGEPGATVTVTEGRALPLPSTLVTICTTTVLTDGTWECTATSDLSDGPHTFDISQTDPAGNTSSSSTSLEVAVIRTISVVSIRLLSGYDYYTTGEDVLIEVEYSSPVLVSNNAYLRLQFYGKVANALYESGSGTNRVVFKYTVLKGDESNMLDYFGIRYSFGGSITSLAGVPVNNTLPEPGKEGSLKVPVRAIIDTKPPHTVLALQDPNYDGTSHLKLTAYDTQTGIHSIVYRVNSGPYQIYTEPINILRQNRLEIGAIDGAGNFTGPRRVEFVAPTRTERNVMTLTKTQLGGNIFFRSYTIGDTVDMSVRLPGTSQEISLINKGGGIFYASLSSIQFESIKIAPKVIIRYQRGGSGNSVLMSKTVALPSYTWNLKVFDYYLD